METACNKMYAICFNSEQISKIFFAKKNLADGNYHCCLSGEAHKKMYKNKEYIFKRIQQSRFTEKTASIRSLLTFCCLSRRVFDNYTVLLGFFYGVHNLAKV